eukprot:GHVL01044775.1.p1 GENE.GHVL01044775.1~~GHVL01044775.1.p1  ORF type:complete len:502 (+),score=46.75 GHVL01044775.1:1532-3037(+)
MGPTVQFSDLIVRMKEFWCEATLFIKSLAKKIMIKLFSAGIIFQFEDVPTASQFLLKNNENETMNVNILSNNTLISADPSMVKLIMVDNGDNYTARFGSRAGLAFIGMLSNGIIWTEEIHDWKRFRRWHGDTAIKSGMNAVVPICSKIIWELVERVENSSDGMMHTNLLDEMRWVTFRFTMASFFGVATNNEFPGLWTANSLDSVTDSKSLEAAFIDEWGLIRAIGHYFKAWQFFLLKRRLFWALEPSNTIRHLLSIRKLNKKIKKLVKILNLISKGESFWSSMKKDNISNEGVVQLTIEMILAGTDTSSVTMYYTLLALSEHTDIRHLLREEARRVCEIGKQDSIPHGWAPTVNQLSKMDLLDRCIKESMRLKSVGPVIMRRALTRDPAIGLEKNDQIILLVQRMHLNEQFFSDPYKFKPERWLEDPVPYAFCPFGYGPKGCLGKHLALLEMKATITIMLIMLDWENVSPSLLETSTKWEVANIPTNDTSAKLSIFRPQK